MMECKVVNIPQTSLLIDVDLLFNKSILDTKRYLHPGLSMRKASHLMGVSTGELRAYLSTVFGVRSFRYIKHWYRIEDALDLWKQDESITIRELAKAVGYGSWISFMYWFIRMKF